MTPWLALVAFLQQGEPGDEPGNFLWPLGLTGQAAYALRATYGQLEGGDSSAKMAGDHLHGGIDIIAEKKHEEVFAIEDGTVVEVVKNGYRSGVLISSKNVSGRAFLYFHLEPDTIDVVVHQKVTADEYLGEVVLDDPVTEVRHLHLARLGRPPSGGWKPKDEWSVRNPLALIDSSVLDDDQMPQIVDMEDGDEIAVRSDESSPSSPYAKPLQGLPRGNLDLLVRLRDKDRPSSVHLLAPYKIHLAIRDENGGTEECAIVFDGPLDKIEPKDCYNLAGGYVSVGTSDPPDYDYYFVASNGGSPPSTSNCWKARKGPYEITITARDVAGNEQTKTVDLAVQ